MGLGLICLWVMYMRIKEVMNKYKVTRKALLLYEERGLIQPDRELSGYRDYRLVDIEVLKKIILLILFG